MRQERIKAATQVEHLEPGARVEIAIGTRTGERGTVVHRFVTAGTYRVAVDGGPELTYAGWELRRLTAGELAGAGQGQGQGQGQA